jgi:hypothetical protein
MSAVVENDEPGAERASGSLRGLERDRVFSAMDDQGRNRDMGERRRQVEITEAAPHALLDSAHDAKGREVVRASGVGEVAGDTELEAALAVRIGVALAQAGRGELRAHLLDRGSLLPARKLRLELLPVRARDGSGIDENQGTGNWRLATGGCRVEHRQQPTPRVADDFGAIERQLAGDGGEVFDVGLPGYWRWVIGPRLTASASASIWGSKYW